jgi:branched-chain amino acid transport system permease protein
VLSYVLAGLSLGAIYAIAASSLVITYVSSGIFNLAFAAMAYSVARVYYFLNTGQGWSIPAAAVAAILVFGPLLGMALYLLLFRYLRLRSQLVKIVATIGLSVALPQLIDLVFGKLTNVTAPGLAHRPLRVFHVLGSPVNMDQVMTYLGLLVVLIAGVGLLRFTSIGLKVRALVDSEALTSLSGTSPSRVSLGVWAASAALAGLAGILIAPTAGLSMDGMTSLMTAAFAAVVAARLKSIPIAVVVALVMGVVTDLLQWPTLLNPQGPLAPRLVPSVPFAFILVFLLYYAFRGQAGDSTTGGALDRAIRPQGGDPSAIPAASTGGGRGRLSLPLVASTLTVLVVAGLLLSFNDYWAGLAASGIALGIALLSYTLVTGEGGMVWLCQITFAGFGAIFSAELATSHGWPVLLAVFGGALAVVPMGVLLGILTIRLGNLYVALVTLTFGLLTQTLIFTQDPFYNFGTGASIARPSFATGNSAFAFLALGAFLVLGLLIINVRRSTAGMAMTAVRWSENGARTLGLSVVQTKVLVSGLATYVAAVGGGFLAMSFQSTLPDSFSPFIGLIWLSVLVTQGARSIIAALVAGLFFYLLPGVFQAYLPGKLSDVPVLLFGLGAILLAKNPDGVVAMNGRQIASLMARRRSGGTPVPPPAQPGVPPDTAPDTPGTDEVAPVQPRLAAGGRA